PSTAGTASIRLSCRAMRDPGRATSSPALLCACLPVISGWATGTALTRPTNTSLASLRIRKYRASTARQVLLSSIYTKWRRRPEGANCALPSIGISLASTAKHPKKGILMKTTKQRSRSHLVVFVIGCILILAAGSIQRAQQRQRHAVDSNGAPLFKVDPFWPKPLPNRWGMQQVTGIFVDQSDHIWFLNRAAKGSPPLKQNNQQTDILVSKGRFNLDEDAREIYIINWKRLLVYDMDTGAFKRGWGGHGMPLSEITNDPIPGYKWTGGPPPEEKNFVPDLHFVEFSKDGLVYIGERGQNRIEVFTKQGKFLREFYVSPNTPSRGEICGGLYHEKFPPC